MVKLLILGVFYIGAMPVVVWLANSQVAARNRHEFVFICIEIIKFTTNVILSYEMNAQQS
jgi:hypothetical protein